MLLQGKVIIISGIGPGLGIKLALHAAQEGARGVVLAARTQSKLDDAQQQIQALNTDTETLAMVNDICERQQCDALVASTLERFGRIDALINSAYYHGDFENIETADLNHWRTIMETNLIGTMNMTQAVIPAMKTQQCGAIVMINTQATRIPAVLDIGGESGYASSKGALAVCSKYLAKELGAYGIRVNNCFMGWMWGEPVQGYVEQTAAEQGVAEQTVIDQLAKNIALNRICTDDECAKAALFLASDYATAVTGATLDANGGEFMPT